MAVQKIISDLPIGSASDDDSVPILDGGVTKRVLLSVLAAYVEGKITFPVTSVDGQTGPVDLSGSYVPLADPVLIDKLTLGDAAADDRVPFQSHNTLVADPDPGGGNHVGHLLQSVVDGDWSADDGADPGFVFGLNVFTTTDTGSGDADAVVAMYGGLIEVAVRAPSGTTIGSVIGLQAEASFMSATADCAVTTMTSLKVAAPTRKNGATAGVATNAYGLRVEAVSASAVGATTAYSVFVQGGATQLDGTTQVKSLAAASVPLVVKGATSQSEALTRWKDSTDSTVARITSNGSVTSAATVTAREGQSSQASVGAVGTGSTAGIAFGSSSDVVLYRSAADVASFAAGDSLAIEGTYNGGQLRLGSYRYWVDSDGVLRTKTSAPGSATDGTAVATRIGHGSAVASGGTHYLGIPGTGIRSVSTRGHSINQSRYYRVLLRAPVVVDQLWFEVTTAPASNANVRTGICAADAEWQPTGAALIDIETAVASGFTGVKTPTPGAPVTLQPGRYLLRTNVDVTMTLRSFALAGDAFVAPTGGATPLNEFQYLSETYGAMANPPADWTAVAATSSDNNSTPVLMRWTDGA